MVFCGGRLQARLLKARTIETKDLVSNALVWVQVPSSAVNKKYRTPVSKVFRYFLLNNRSVFLLSYALQEQYLRGCYHVIRELFQFITFQIFFFQILGFYRSQIFLLVQSPYIVGFSLNGQLFIVGLIEKRFSVESVSPLLYLFSNIYI